MGVFNGLMIAKRYLWMENVRQACFWIAWSSALWADSILLIDRWPKMVQNEEPFLVSYDTDSTHISPFMMLYSRLMDFKMDLMYNKMTLFDNIIHFFNASFSWFLLKYLFKKFRKSQKITQLIDWLFAQTFFSHNSSRPRSSLTSVQLRWNLLPDTSSR